MLNIEEIQKILPQRYPFLMIDRVLELEPGKKAVAIKNVTINDGFFAGQFPGKPVMPGVMIIEAMAQAAIILFSGQVSYSLVSLKASFLNPVFPGDQLKITVEPVKILSGEKIVRALAGVGDKKVAEAEFSFSVKEEK